MEKHPKSDSSRAPSDLRHPLDWPAAKGAVDDVLQELDVRLARQRLRSRRRAMRVGVAALALMVGFVGWTRYRSPQVDRPGIASSAIVSLPERQLLSDGSVVELRQDAKISVHFSDSRRGIVLERGEAHFDVRKDPLRPFVVTAGEVEFRAVGTAFAVSYSSREVEMLVTSGRVAVETRASIETSPSANGTPSAHVATLVQAEPLIVEARTRVVVDMAGVKSSPPAVSKVSETDLSRRLAWRAPKLEFTGTPLGQAIAMIHQQAPAGLKTRLVLGEPSLAAVRISGILRADNIDVLLGLLEEDHGIRAERRGEGEVVLYRSR